MESITNGKNAMAVKEYVSKNKGLPLILLLASLVCLIAAVERCSDGNCEADGEVYAVVGAVVSTLCILLFMLYDASKGVDETVELLVFWFLFVWWAVYAGYTTFRAPFVNTTNGYFAAWLGLIASTGLVVSKTKNAPSFLQNKADELGVRQAIILMFSIVVILAGIPPCCGENLAIVALVAGSGSVLFIILRVVFELDSETFSAFLCLWWLIFTVVLTFGLFLNAGNGFFGCWICLVTSILLVADER